MRKEDELLVYTPWALIVIVPSPPQVKTFLVTSLR
jgi:hypothetical protein